LTKAQLRRRIKEENFDFSEIRKRAGAIIDPLLFAAYLQPDHYSGFAAHFKQINAKLHELMTGKIKRLIINLPPGYGKSDFVTKRFTAWYLGKNPNHDVIISAYGALLAEDFSASIRDMMRTENYQNLFPGVRIAADAKAKSNWRITVKKEKRGHVIAAGIGGQSTGRRANLYVIDDPVKNIMEAVSPVIMSKHFDWYRTSARTRLHPDGKMVIIMTRWVENDLTGELLAAMEKGGEKFDVLSLPAINEQGLPLWPERYDLQEVLESKAALGERFFQAMHQQAPDDKLEGMFGTPNNADFKPDEWRDCKRIAVLDPGYGGDTTALSILTFKRDHSVKDWLRHRAFSVFVQGYVWPESIKTLYEQITLKLYQHNAGTLFIEKNADKGYSLDSMRKYWPACKGINTKLNKHIKITTTVGRYWENLVFDSAIQPAYISQVLGYREGGTDDAPDSLAMGLQELLTDKFSIRYAIDG